MHIHFICRGNSFRSRLAEAYLASLNLKDVTVSSSGTCAKTNISFPISPNVLEVATIEGIAPYFKPHKDQLTQETLNGVDIVVCLNRKIYREAKALVTLPLQTIIWDVSDLEERYPLWRTFSHTWIISHERSAFTHIKKHIHELVSFLYHKVPGDQIAVLDRKGNPTGEQVNIQEASQRGLWHMVSHVVLYNAKQDVLLVRRSKTIVGNPGLWELGIGGSADSTETAITAILRELSEEIGVSLEAKDLYAGPRWTYSHYMPRYGLHGRAFIYSFAAQIPSTTTFSLQESETDRTLWLPLKDIKKALKKGHGDFGVLVHQPGYYRRLVAMAEEHFSSTPL